MSAINRRSILAGAAAVPVATAAIPAIAGTGCAPDAAIFDLVKRLSNAWKHLEEVCTMREVAEDLMSQGKTKSKTSGRKGQVQDHSGHDRRRDDRLG